MTARYAFFASLCLLFTAPAFAAERNFDTAGRQVTEWTANRTYYQKAPIVLFSHGMRGCPTDSRFLVKALADKGFWVFAPAHRDARCKGSPPPLAGVPEKRAEYDKPHSWDEDTYASRMDDINTVLESLRNDESRRSDLDFSRIALVGYDLGGYTVLGMAGAWPEWKEKWDHYGVKAIIALSPYTTPYTINKSLGGINLPVLIESGSKDHRNASLLQPETGVYEQIVAPKYLAVIRNASGGAWTREDEETRDPIVRYALAFLQYYLTGDENPTLTQGSDRVTYAYQSELGSRPLEGRKSGFASSTPGQTIKGGNSSSETIKGGNSSSQTIKGGNSGGEPTLRSGDWRDRYGKETVFKKKDVSGYAE